MIRREFLIALAALAMPARAALGQQPGNMPRIGFMSTDMPALSLDPFREGLRQHGYVEGRNIAFEVRPVGNMPDAEQLYRLASELVRLNVGVIVAGGSDVIRAAQRATSTIPIVMAQTADAVGAGFVSNLARPGGNTTGVNSQSGPIGEKRLQLVKDIIRGARRVAVLSNSGNPSHASGIRVLREAARSLALELHVVEVRGPQHLPAALSEMTAAGADAALVLPAGVFSSRRAEILQQLARAKLPAIWWRREYVEEGGLLSYGPDNPAMYRQAANYVDRILKGAKPGDLPVEQPSKFEVFVNLRTAKALGVQIPSSVLVMADKVIQ